MNIVQMLLVYNKTMAVFMEYLLDLLLFPAYEEEIRRCTKEAGELIRHAAGIQGEFHTMQHTGCCNIMASRDIFVCTFFVGRV